MSHTAQEWKPVTPYPQIAPCFADDGTLGLRSDRPGYSMGRWIGTYRLNGPKGLYRISVPWQGKLPTRGRVFAIATWRRKDGSMMTRDYFVRRRLGEGGILKLEIAVPVAAHTLSLELGAWGFGPLDVLFETPDVRRAGPVEPRKVVVATAWIPFVDSDTKTLEGNLADLLRTIDAAGSSTPRPDLLVLPETAYDRRVPGVGTAGFLKDDHPVMRVLLERAQRHDLHIVFSYHEDDCGTHHNTSALISPDRGILGRYRKVHLPMDEVEEGFAPGDGFPVFETRFGRVGLLICWDQYFPESARLLHLGGAEILCVSTAGDSPEQLKARAIDTGLPVVVSGVAGPGSSRILDGRGRLLARVSGNEPGIALAEIDLARRNHVPWLSVGDASGDPRSLFEEERRPDLYGEIVRER